MNGYLPDNEACEKLGMKLYALNKLIDAGKVRMKETSNLTKRRHSPVRLVCIQDIMDAQSNIELRYIDVKSVGDVYGLTPNAVRYHIMHHRLRWRRQGANLQACADDLDIFVLPVNAKPVGRPKGLLGHSA